MYLARIFFASRQDSFILARLLKHSVHKICLVVSLCTAYILWDKIPWEVFKYSSEEDGLGITNSFRKMKDSWTLGKEKSGISSGISIASCLLSSWSLTVHAVCESVRYHKLSYVDMKVGVSQDDDEN